MNQLSNNPSAILRQFFFSSIHTAMPSLVLQDLDFTFALSYHLCAYFLFTLFLSAVFCLQYNSQIRKWFEPRSDIPWLKRIIWVIGVLRRTVVIDWRFDSLCGSHLKSQVLVLVSWKFKNPGERFDWSVDRVAIVKCVIWLAVKTCAEIGYANRRVVKYNSHRSWFLYHRQRGFVLILRLAFC